MHIAVSINKDMGKRYIFLYFQVYHWPMVLHGNQILIQSVSVNKCVRST